MRTKADMARPGLVQGRHGAWTRFSTLDNHQQATAHTEQQNISRNNHVGVCAEEAAPVAGSCRNCDSTCALGTKHTIPSSSQRGANTRKQEDTGISHAWNRTHTSWRTSD